MNLNNLFADELNGITTDFKAEVIAAEMIENNTPADRVLIVPIGAMNRPQNKDIDSVLSEVSEYDNKEYILIRTHKEGLYDKLPEGLFHNPISYSGDKTEQQVIEGIKRHRIEEKAARMFFLPFDTALFNARVQIALYENQLDKKFHNNQLINIFSPHWPIFKHLNVLQSNIFLQFLPVIHSIRDDWKAIETLFELIFLIPAHIKLRTMTKQDDTQKNTPVTSAIGAGSLGIDLTTGSVLDGGGFSEIVITFGPLSAAQVNNFIGNQQQEKVVLMLCDYLLPADLDIVIEYDLINHDRSCILPKEGETANNCTMGVSTYL
ncbi:MAG: type secretion system baseplate subunit TssG [Segetibacter sp.]|nr:type secretion system baseplate subunit TssG [Segetibacter sp.]